MTTNEKNADAVVAYIDKYVEKNAECYKLLKGMINSEKIENEFSDKQWAYIIEQAWQLAYKKAMEDNYLSPEEKIELNNINDLSLAYQPKDRMQLNYRILTSFKKLDNIKYPKPTPYDNYNK